MAAFPHLTDLSSERRDTLWRLHRRVPVIDCHCDAIQDVRKGKRRLAEASATGHVDFPRALDGGLGCQVFALAVLPPDYGRPAHEFLKQHEAMMCEIEAANDRVQLCTTTDAIEQAHAAGKLAAVLSIEGGEVLEGDLDLLHTYYHLGVRMLGPVWFWKNELGGGTWEDPEPSGLTPFGREVLREMSRLGMVIDTAHMTEKGFWDALECAEGRPVICSHAGVRNVVNTGKYNTRNLWDDQIKALAQTGGVLGIIFSKFCLDNFDATIPDLVRFFTRAAELAGPEYIGFGSDYDGTRPPAGLEDISGLPRLTSALMDAGFTEPELVGILGGNFLRVFRQVWGA